MRKINILPGLKNNRWTITNEVEQKIYSGRSYRMVKVKCECGNEKEIKLISFLSGHSKSCGCFNAEKLLMRNTKHNLSYSRIHRIWKGMKERCNNPKAKAYKNYGGRGIKVCDEWNDNFEKFFKDMKEGYADNLTIDRVDNNGSYCKDNCRWATNTEQQKNKRGVA